MKNIRFLIPVILALYCTSAVGQELVDIGIFPSTTVNQMEVRVRPNYAEDGSRYLTNAQFTVKWLISSGIPTITMGAQIPPFSFIQQGPPLTDGGYYYQRYATNSGNAVTWVANVEIVALTFTFTAPPCPEFEIADDAFVNDIYVNGAYYFEVNGLPKTGIIYQSPAQQPSPAAAGTISGTPVVCQGESGVSYSVGTIANASSYDWSYSGTGATITGDGTSSITIAFDASATSGSLTVQGVNACGTGILSPDYAITVSPTSVGGTAAVATPILCSGNSTTIDLAGQIGTIQWQQSADGSSGWADVTGGSGGTTTTYTTPNLTATTYYRAEVTSGVCAVAYSNVVSVTIIQPPVAPTTAAVFPTSVCVDDPGNVTLSYTGGSGTVLKWYEGGCGTGTSIGSGNDLSIASPAVTTTYYARWESDPCTASACASVTVTVIPLPVAPASAAVDRTGFCADDPGNIVLSYTGGSGTELKWYEGGCGSGTSIGSGNNLSIASPAVTTTYYARWESPPCATSTCASVMVDVIPAPVAPVSAAVDRTGFCADDPGDIVLSYTGGSGTILKWYAGGCGSGTSIGSGNNLTIASPVTTTTYYARWESDPCAASACANVTVNVIPAPVAPVSAAVDRNNLCVDDAGNIILSYTGGSGTILKWYAGGCGLGTSIGSGNNLTIASPTTTTTYYARWESPPCAASACASVTVTVNPLPVVYAGADKSIPYGTSTTISDATASGTATLLYAWTPAASFVDPSLLNPTTVNLISTAAYTFTVTDGNGCINSDQMTITVTGGPLAVNPSATPTAVCSGQPSQLNANASGGSGSYTYTWTSTPAGFNSGLANPVVNPTVTTTYHIAVNDGYNNANSNVVVTVNTPPALAAIGNKSVNEQVALTFTATATDPEVPPQVLTYSLDGAAIALGMSINAATGAFSWTPAESQGGASYPVTITVADNGPCICTDFETISITVNETNVAPVLAPIGSKTVNELALLTFTATATDGDLPANTLTFSLVGAPTGAAINPSTGVFTWTPTEAQGPGSYPVTVKVCDNGTPSLCDEELITITVNEVNVAPVLAAIGNKSVNELALLTFTASATDGDLPANTLTFSLGAGAPAGAAIDPSTGMFTWTPAEDQGPGTYTFTVKVCDDGTPVLCDEEEIEVTVNEVNVAPVLAAIGNKSVNELALLTFTASATDGDIPANTLTFSLVGAPAGASINPSTGVFTWTPTEGQGPGSYPVTVKVCDNGTPSLCDEELITITVNEVGAAPVLAPIGNKTVNELALLTFTATATDDDPGTVFAFSLVGAPAGAVIDPVTGVFTWTPTEGQGPGTYTFTVKVCDDGTPVLCDEEEIEVTVNEVNTAPVLATIGDQSVTELTLLTFTATATDGDLPANTLAFSLVGAPAGAAIDPATGVFTWTPAEDQGPGSYPVTVKICDNGTPSLCDEELITITVNEVNVAPVLAPIGDKTVNELALLTFTATATDDDPGTVFAFSLVGAPAGAAIDPATGVFTWTPTEDQGPGSYTFTVKVCDNGTPPLCAEEEITVTVNEVMPANMLTLTLYLQGPYLGAGVMSTALNTNGQVPLTQPYNTPPWNYAGEESVAALDELVVDWILVELRSTTTEVFARKAGLLYNDGTAVVSFEGLSDLSEYYVVAWHRNHLPVMSQQSIAIPETGAVLDLSIAENCYGTTPLIHLDGPRYGLIAGEVIPDGQLRYSGAGNDRGPILARILEEGGLLISDTQEDGYWSEDVNMNNVLKYIGSNNDRGPIISNISTLIPGALLTSIYYSQVPGVYGGVKGQLTGGGPVDVHLVGSAEGIDVVLRTNELIGNGVVDNIQFALAWKADDAEMEEMLSAYSSGYLMEQQGDPVQIGDTKYLVFVSVTATYLPSVWYEGEEQTVLSFETALGGAITGRLWIADDSFTSQNNAAYYVSVWGTDRTGSIADPIVVSVDEPTAQVTIRTYPNPVYNGKLTVDLYAPQDQTLTVSIFDASGNLVVDRPWKTLSPHAMQVLDLSTLPPGAYTLRITGEWVNYHTKLVLLTLN